MKQLFTLLLIVTAFNSDGQTVYAGLQKSPLRDLLKPLAGTLIITDTQTVNTWNRSWAQEGTMFFDEAAGNVKIYFTGGADSAGSTAFNNKIGYVTTTDMVTYSTPTRAFGQGIGGAPSGRRATSAWVGKENGKYYALALNGYPIPYPGQDQNIYGYTSNDGIVWADAGLKFNKYTAWSDTLIGFGNTGICVDEFNNPVKIGGKYIALVDGWNGSTWTTYKAEADSLMGNWTLTNQCTSLKLPSSNTYGSCQLIYHKGLFFSFYLYGIGGGDPSRLAYATSTDAINWNIKEAPFLGLEAMPYGANTDQLADVNVCEYAGKTYFIANFNQNAPTFKGQIRLWTYPGTFTSLLSQVLY